jgi:hypothetical protein
LGEEAEHSETERCQRKRAEARVQSSATPT